MNIWDQLVDCICRPPRDQYNPNDLLGGHNQTFMVGNMEATRIDFELTNKLGQTMKCSHYIPLDAKSKDGSLPVVVYCHCNSGSRRDAEEAVWHLLPCGVGVVAFDFTGSGLSDGKWVTLGAHEVDDLAVVIQHLRSLGGISSIGLWGRSMGAVTALLYSHRDPDIAGMALDSPFSRLTDLMLEIVVNQKLPIPRMMLKLALKLMRTSVKRKAGCDINAVSPLDVVGKSLIPALFGHGEEDSFISIQHSEKLHEAYNASAEYPVYKNLVRFKGDHNHPRPPFFYSSVCCFFHQQLKLDQVLLGGTPTDAQRLLTQGSLNLSGEPQEQVNRANGFVNTPWSLDNMPHLNDMPPEEQRATAAAAAAALETYRDETAGTTAAPAAGSDLQDLLLSSEGGLNSPKAVRGTQSRRGLELPGSAPAGRFEDLMRRQQQQHGRQQLAGSSQPVGIVGSGGFHHGRQQQESELFNDSFEVGSRGNNLNLLGSIPSPVAAGAPLGLSGPRSSTSSSDKYKVPGSSSGAGSSSSNGSSSSMQKSSVVSTPVATAGVGVGVGVSNLGTSAKSSSSSPLNTAGSFMAAGGQSLKRLLMGKTAASSNGSSSGMDAAAGKSTAAAAGGGNELSRRSIDNSALQQSASSALTLSPQQQQQTCGALPAISPPAAVMSSPLAAGAGALYSLQAPASANGLCSSKQQAIRTAPVRYSSRDRVHSGPGIDSLIGFGVQDDAGAWVGLSIEDADSAMDPDLAAAIAASLQDQHTLMGAHGAAADETQPGLEPANIAGSSIQQQARGSRVPTTLQEEEEMLRQAIALSLAETQQSEHEQQQEQKLLQQQQQEQKQPDGPEKLQGSGGGQLQLAPQSEQ